MMFAQDEAIALQRVGRVGQFKRLACSGILRRGHLVLATAQALGGPSLAHERKGLRHDERKILAEKRVHLARSRNRRILADAEQADEPARVMRPHHDRPAAEDHRSDEQTHELQTLIRISYAGLCLTKKKQPK